MNTLLRRLACRYAVAFCAAVALLHYPWLRGLPLVHEEQPVLLFGAFGDDS